KKGGTPPLILNYLRLIKPRISQTPNITTTTGTKTGNLAKNLLIEKKIDFKEINIENDLTIFNELIKKTKSKTVPQIFINEKFIGGYTELNELLKTNKI
ncbi:MAG: hypothetical protein H7835_19620, partial [Magnetococcus sp. XQGC-1]